MPDEYLYKVVDALDEVAPKPVRPSAKLPLTGCLGRPTVSSVISGRAQRGASSSRTFGAIGWQAHAGADCKAGRGQRRAARLPLLGTSATGWSATRCRFKTITALMHNGARRDRPGYLSPAYLVVLKKLSSCALAVSQAESRDPQLLSSAAQNHPGTFADNFAHPCILELSALCPGRAKTGRTTRNPQQKVSFLVR